jgi:ornithine carbamoyltransferase
MSNINLTNRSLLTLKDYTAEEILYLLKLSAQVKQEKKDGIYKKRLLNKNIAAIFVKLSTRTKCSFAVAAADEGANINFFGPNELQLGAKESVEDTARVLGRLYDGITYRGFEHSLVEELAKHGKIPVWNALTDDDHPTQVLADFLTIYERFGDLDRKITYIGDGRNNVAYALIYGAEKIGMKITIVAPKPLQPVVTSPVLTVTDDINEGVLGADVIYTDVWVSMGEEDKSAERLQLLRPYQVTSDVMKATKNPNVIFMHCLPAVKGNEVTEEVFEADYSVVFDEAENRMHTIKAVMIASLT